MYQKVSRSSPQIYPRNWAIISIRTKSAALGFLAGGHLVGDISTRFDKRVYDRAR
jgi:hypothetical protein